MSAIKSSDFYPQMAYGLGSSNKKGQWWMNAITLKKQKNKKRKQFAKEEKASETNVKV
mgnify:FL=1